MVTEIWVEYLPPEQHPLHRWPHAQPAGDGRGFVQECVGSSLIAVTWAVYYVGA